MPQSKREKKIHAVTKPRDIDVKKYMIVNENKKHPNRISFHTKGDLEKQRLMAHQTGYDTIVKFEPLSDKKDYVKKPLQALTIKKRNN